jgi:mono/diheme cytochrome c family protein
MWQSMRERSIQAGEMDEQAAADLFAYFYSVRFFDKPGDAARGKRRFADRDCARCHGLTTAIQSGVKPVSEWQSLNSPFELAEAMWNHLPRIQEAARAQGIALPQLAAQDLPDLLVYVRNFPSRPAAPAEFRTTSGANGEALFQSKGCAGCHRAGSALAARIKGNTLTEIAAAMWNHAPRMAAAGARPAYFEPGEMRELLSYLWARQFFAAEGDASRGRRVFSAKNCARCHAGDSPVGPRLDAKNQSFSAPRIVAGLWHHGPAMLGQMRQQNIPWPRFTAREMADLVAYLDSSGQGR